MAGRIAAARAYFALGYNVLPLRDRSKVCYTPWLLWRYIKQTEAIVEKLFAKDDGNIAIVTGAVSDNLAVIDADTEPLFEKLRQRIAAEGMRTWTLKSSRGGHLYFRTRQLMAGTSGLVDGEKYDVRADGGYMIVPPSTHPNGTPYTFLDQPDVIPLVDDLDWLGIHLDPQPVRTLPAAVIPLLRGETAGGDAEEIAAIKALAADGYSNHEIDSLLRGGMHESRLKGMTSKDGSAWIKSHL